MGAGWIKFVELPFATAVRVRIQTSLKNYKGATKQSSGKHTLARQKYTTTKSI
jgi:hypothetical protein